MVRKYKYTFASVLEKCEKNGGTVIQCESITDITTNSFESPIELFKVNNTLRHKCL